MKQFFGAFFGSIVGIVVAALLVLLLTVIIVKSSISSITHKNETAMSSDSGVLRVVFDGAIHERDRENPFAALAEGQPWAQEDALGMNGLLRKIEAAAKDSKIKTLYLDIRDVRAGFATLYELRDAIEKFRKSGKPVHAYSENYSHKSYFLASVANKVYVNPVGNIDWNGLSMNVVFFRQMLEKLDVKVQVFRHGRFKSAVEPFVMDNMSAANRLQTQQFLSAIWQSMLERIARDRHTSVERLNTMADSLSIRQPSDALGLLVDGVAYEDEVYDELKKLVGEKPTEKLKFIEIEDYHPGGGAKLAASRIAIVYANGSISGGEGSDEEIGSDRLVRAIREARMDDKVKGIVLRVNSPGGSALASDVIWREVTLARKAKPVAVSMGDLAASGGYYISCGADRIFAEPNTITGSIGVFGLLPNIKGLLQKKLGITVDSVYTNRYSGLGNVVRPVSGEEQKFIQQSVERIYDTFTARVAAGRQLPKELVDSIGQGRVWSGSEALRLKLVDEMGGVNDAVRYIAQKAKLSNYRLLELPRQKSPFDGLLGGRSRGAEAMVRAATGPLYPYLQPASAILRMKGVQARLPFEIIGD